MLGGSRSVAMGTDQDTAAPRPFSVKTTGCPTVTPALGDPSLPWLRHFYPFSDTDKPAVHLQGGTRNTVCTYSTPPRRLRPHPKFPG